MISLFIYYIFDWCIYPDVCAICCIYWFWLPNYWFLFLSTYEDDLFFIKVLFDGYYSISDLSFSPPALCLSSLLLRPGVGGKTMLGLTGLLDGLFDSWAGLYMLPLVSFLLNLTDASLFLIVSLMLLLSCTSSSCELSFVLRIGVDCVRLESPSIIPFNSDCEPCDWMLDGPVFYFATGNCGYYLADILLIWACTLTLFWFLLPLSFFVLVYTTFFFLPSLILTLTGVYWPSPVLFRVSCSGIALALVAVPPPPSPVLNWSVSLLVSLSISFNIFSYLASFEL